MKHTIHVCFPWYMAENPCSTSSYFCLLDIPWLEETWTGKLTVLPAQRSVNRVDVKDRREIVLSQQLMMSARASETEPVLSVCFWNHQHTSDSDTHTLSGGNSKTDMNREKQKRICGHKKRKKQNTIIFCKIQKKGEALWDSEVDGLYCYAKRHHATCCI